MAISLSAPRTTELKPRIVVFGVGGAGGNAVNNMIETGLEGCEFVVANTDAQQLQFSKTEKRIQLGVAITQGLGAGAHPEVGMSAAEESTPEVVEHLEGAHMVFITAGMGGGTGTGAAPIIAKAARERGILTVGVVTKPFQFEGRHRMRMADQGIAELQRHVDTLIIIPNQNLFRVANERTTFAEAFAMADQVLHSGVRSITDLMVLPGLINLDFADVRTVMSEMGKAMMGTGEASGEDRALMAAQNAIQNPLLDEVSLKGAKAVLVNVTGGFDMTLLEVDEAANAISAEVDSEANIIFGAAFDPSLEGKIRVSVVATGMDGAAMQAVEPRATRQTQAQGQRAPAPAPAQTYRAPEPARPAATVAYAPEPSPAPAPQPVAAAPAPVYQAPQPQPVQQPVMEAPPPAPLWSEPKRAAFEAEYDRSPEPALARQPELYFDSTPPQNELRVQAPAAAPQPMQYEPQQEPAAEAVEEEAPLFPERSYAADRRKGGFLGLFGGRKAPASFEQPEAPTYRQSAPAQPSRGGAATAVAAQEEADPDAAEDLDIPSFLRRLAN
jgi:cell division protein FtsZ